MWPFKSLANKMAIVYNFWAEKVMKVLHWIAWPFKSLANKIVAAYNFVAGVCSSLKKQVNKQFDDPIKLIEAVLEVIWMMVSPVIRAVIWLCEIIIDVKRDIKVGDRDVLLKTGGNTLHIVFKSYTKLESPSAITHRLLCTPEKQLPYPTPPAHCACACAPPDRSHEGILTAGTQTQRRRVVVLKYFSVWEV